MFLKNVTFNSEKETYSKEMETEKLSEVLSWRTLFVLSVTFFYGIWTGLKKPWKNVKSAQRSKYIQHISS